MNVYPFTIHIGSFTITGFGLMMMFAFLVAGWIMRVELQSAGSTRPTPATSSWPA